MDFGQRLKELRISKNYQQKDLADLLGVSRTAVVRYENNDRFPEKETLIQLAKALNVSLDYLLTGKEAKIHAPAFVMIPVVSQLDNESKYYKRLNLPHQTEKLFYLQVSDVSMISHRIRLNDLLLCKKQSSFEDGDLVIAVIDGKPVLGAITHIADYIFMQPENSSYKPLILDNNHSIDIRAKVLQAINELNSPSKYWANSELLISFENLKQRALEHKNNSNHTNSDIDFISAIASGISELVNNDDILMHRTKKLINKELTEALANGQDAFIPVLYKLLNQIINKR